MNHARTRTCWLLGFLVAVLSLAVTACTGAATPTTTVPAATAPPEPATGVSATCKALQTAWDLSRDDLRRHGSTPPTGVLSPVGQLAMEELNLTQRQLKGEDVTAKLQRVRAAIKSVQEPWLRERVALVERRDAAKQRYQHQCP